MIGTNNLGNPPRANPEDTAKGVKCVVKTVRKKLPEAKVLLLAVFPRGMAADDAYRAQIKTINDTIAKLDDGKHVHYLDIGKKFFADDGTLPKDIMPDALHPNAKGYQIWADAIDEAVKEMVGGAMTNDSNVASARRFCRTPITTPGQAAAPPRMRECSYATGAKGIRIRGGICTCPGVVDQTCYR